MKLCYNCMAKMRDDRDNCPYCNWQQSKGVRDSLQLIPGNNLSSARYMVGRAKQQDSYAITYIGWDYQEQTPVTITEYAPKRVAIREVGNPLMTMQKASGEDLFGAGLQVFLDTGMNLMENRESFSDIWVVRDCFVENGTGYVVTDQLDGQSLQELMQQGQHVFDPDSAVQIIQAILGQLKRLHTAGFLHLGVCPENILMMADGSIRLAFPRSGREVTEKESGSSQSIYDSEELFRSTGNPNSASDVYSAAATLYLMMTGEQIPPAQSRCISDQIVEPRKYNKAIPSNVQNAVMNALLVRAEDRTQSAAQFSADLSSSNVERKNVKQPEHMSRKEKNKLVRNILIGCGAVAALVIVFTIINMISGKKLDETSFISSGVPYLEGKDIEEAREIAEKKNYSLDVKYVIRENATGTIIEQDPKAHASSSDGIIHLIVSGGDEIVTCPDLEGLTAENARDTLEAVNLKVTDVKTEFNNEVKRGDLIKIMVKGNDSEESSLESVKTEEGTIQQGTNLVFYVSKGSYDEYMPSFTASEIEDAIRGKSIGEEPVAGETANDTTKAYGSLQQLIDQKLSEQETIMEEMENGEPVSGEPVHFLLSEGSTDFSDTIGNGKIIRLSQSEGSFRPVSEDGSSTVLSLVISKGPDKVTIPNVVGLSEGEANSALRNAGFNVGSSTSYNSKYAKGTVCAQSQTGKAKKGATITITISLGKKVEKTQSESPSNGDGATESGVNGKGGDVENVQVNDNSSTIE